MKIKKKVQLEFDGYDHEKGMPYNPNDPNIWYNNEKLKEKVLRIKNKFGEPSVITKTGEMLYEDCVVIPTFNETKYE